MMLSIGEMHRNGIQHHALPDDPDSFISLLLFDYVVWHDFIPVNFTFIHQFLPMHSENDLFLTLFAQLTYVSVLHWIVRLYYYGILVNEGICIILVIDILSIFCGSL